MNNKDSILREIWYYLRTHKRWWLLPIVIILVFLGIVLVIGQTAPIISPFIYTIF